METLFDMTDRNWDGSGKLFVRPSVRGIMIRNGKIAMVKSLKYDYWKFPGGGIDEGESHTETLIREVREEAGLTVSPGSIREYGLVPRVERSDMEGVDWFVQENYYYLCDAEDGRVPQELDRYEDEERFTLFWTDPETAIRENRTLDHGPKSQTMLEREALVLERLAADGLLG